MEQEDKLFDEVETARELTYLGDRMSAGGGCEAVMTARIRYGLDKFRECSELLHGMDFNQDPRLIAPMHYPLSYGVSWQILNFDPYKLFKSSTYFASLFPSCGLLINMFLSTAFFSMNVHS